MFGKLKIEEHNGTVYIPVSKTACKAAIGKFQVYDYNWLLDHLEQEYIALMGARKLRDTVRNGSIDKDWSE